MTAEFDWQVAVQIAGVIVALAGGVASVPLINALKQAAGMNGRWAQAITVAVSVLLAILTMIASGAIAPEPLSVEYIGSLLTAVLLASQAEYRRLKDQMGQEIELTVEEIEIDRGYIAELVDSYLKTQETKELMEP